MPKAIGDFKDSIVFKFIELVKRRPYIWNQNHDNYNDRGCALNGWKEIEEALSDYADSTLTVNLLRQKWKNLRDTFKRELKKCSSNNPDDYIGKWIFFRAIFFLADESLQDEIEIYLNEGNGEEMPNDKFEIKIESTDEQDDHDIDDAVVDKLGDEIPNIETKRIKIQNKTETTNDYDLMFLKSLVPYFTHLDPRRKLVLRNKLQTILLDELNDQDGSAANRED